MEEERKAPSRKMWQAMRDGIDQEIVKYDTIGSLIGGVVEHIENENSPMMQQLKLMKAKNPDFKLPTINKK